MSVDTIEVFERFHQVHIDMVKKQEEMIREAILDEIGMYHIGELHGRLDWCAHVHGQMWTLDMQPLIWIGPIIHTQDDENVITLSFDHKLAVEMNIVFMERHNG